MDWGGPQFVLAIIAMSMFAGIVKMSIRARHGLPIEGRGRRRYREERGDSDEVVRLKSENARLVSRLEASEDRLAVLERIVTDKSYNLASEIEALRDRPVAARHREVTAQGVNREQETN